MLKTFLKWTGVIILVLALGLYLIVSLKQDRKFDAPYPNVFATDDSVVISRGKYLVFGPAHCATCHVAHDMERQILNGEIVPLSGGNVFDLPIGKFYTKNLTPDETGIGKWKDPEIARALRYGVAQDGRALLDIMPFHNTSDEDLIAIISFLRHQEPVKKHVPEHHLNILGKVVNAFLLEPVGPSDEVPLSVKQDTTAEYGKYLANSVANCRGCHTNRNLMTGEFVGEDYAGGFALETETDSGTYIVTSPNLTPHATGRLKGWTQEQFIARFKMGTLIPQSHMPWGPFSHMNDNELRAIYTFLQTLKPVDNAIQQTLVLKK